MKIMGSDGNVGFWWSSRCKSECNKKKKKRDHFTKRHCHEKRFTPSLTPLTSTGAVCSFSYPASRTLNSLSEQFRSDTPLISGPTPAASNVIALPFRHNLDVLKQEVESVVEHDSCVQTPLPPISVFLDPVEEQFHSDTPLMSAPTPVVTNAIPPPY